MEKKRKRKRNKKKDAMDDDDNGVLCNPDGLRIFVKNTIDRRNFLRHLRKFQAEVLLHFWESVSLYEISTFAREQDRLANLERLYTEIVKEDLVSFVNLKDKNVYQRNVELIKTFKKKVQLTGEDRFSFSSTELHTLEDKLHSLASSIEDVLVYQHFASFLTNANIIHKTRSAPTPSSSPTTDPSNFLFRAISLPKEDVALLFSFDK
jgi:hypothetical protein